MQIYFAFWTNVTFGTLKQEKRKEIQKIKRSKTHHDARGIRVSYRKPQANPTGMRQHRNAMRQHCDTHYHHDLHLLQRRWERGGVEGNSEETQKRRSAGAQHQPCQHKHRQSNSCSCSSSTSSTSSIVVVGTETLHRQGHFFTERYGQHPTFNGAN